MIISSNEAEKRAVLSVAEQMCVAARTAPKAKGIDLIETCIVTGEDKEALAKEMERLSDEFGFGFFKRDANNVRSATAVVLVGTASKRRGLMEGCGYCGFKNCTECTENNGACIFNPMDLGIAIGSMASVAMDNRVDNRIMFSVGKAAVSLNILGNEVKMVIGIPLSVSGKSPFFDR